MYPDLEAAPSTKAYHLHTRIVDRIHNLWTRLEYTILCILALKFKQDLVDVQKFLASHPRTKDLSVCRMKPAYLRHALANVIEQGEYPLGCDGPRRMMKGVENGRKQTLFDQYLAFKSRGDSVFEDPAMAIEKWFNESEDEEVGEEGGAKLDDVMEGIIEGA